MKGRREETPPQKMSDKIMSENEKLKKEKKNSNI